MSQTRFSPNLIAGIILTLLIGIALYLRVYLPYDHVFSGEWIKFTGVDAYYHMRLVDNLLSHFPQHITFDPYTFYPHGHTIGWPPFFDGLLAGIIWLIGLGSPSQHTIDVVGVYFPAILGALTLIPVYFIGKELFNRWVGVLSAGLVTLLPSGFLSKSILGFTDHHVAETLFTTVTILFLILAIKSAKQKQLVFDHLKCGEWAIIGKPLLYSLLAGIFLGIYLLTWVGGLLFIFLIFVYFIIQSISDHLRGENTDYLAIISTLSMLTALIISLPLLPQASWLSPLYLPSFIIATLTPLVLSGISRLLTSRKIKPTYYPLTLVGLGLAGLSIFYIVEPSLLKSMIDKFGIFTPAGASLTILEVQPLLFPVGNFSLSLAWSNFTTGFFLSFIALGILIYLIVKHGDADKSLLVVWSLLILVATLGQRRFGYYFAVNVALLTSYLSILIYFVIQFIIDYLRGENTDYRRRQILHFAGFRQMMTKPVGTIKVAKKKTKRKKPPKAAVITTSRISAALGIVVIFFLVFFPNISGAVAIVKEPRFAPDDAWYEALSWLKENTPDPFGDPSAYYELYEPPPWGEDYNYPEPAYGVMSWWPSGHWITRIAHRIPVANPFQSGVRKVAQFFTAQDETLANEMMNKLDSRYVVIDHATVGKFYAMATFIGGTQEEFYEFYYRPLQGRLQPIQLFYPEYYQSLAVRLYNFDGGEVAAESPVVISYEQKISPGGALYKGITSSQTFSNYEEASAYVSSQKSENYRIVGINPFISPVPLDALEHYQLIYSSTDGIMQPEVGMMPAVKIFEYIK